MIHYTLNTGHVIEQPNQGPLGVYEIMAPLLDGGNVGKVAPSLSAFRVDVARAPGGALFIVWRGREPLVICGLAMTAETSGPVWAELERLYLMASDKNPDMIATIHVAVQPKETPWLGVVLLPGLNFLTLKDAHWIGVFERCMAWTLLRDEELGQTRSRKPC